jgi:hypothetical protein
MRTTSHTKKLTNSTKPASRAGFRGKPDAENPEVNPEVKAKIQYNNARLIRVKALIFN